MEGYNRNHSTCPLCHTEIRLGHCVVTRFKRFISPTAPTPSPALSISSRSPDGSAPPTLPLVHDPSVCALEDWMALHPPSTLRIVGGAAEALGVKCESWPLMPSATAIRSIALYNELCDPHMLLDTPTAEQRQVTRDAILKLAQTLGHTECKWLFPCAPREVDKAWDILVRALARSQPGKGLSGCGVSCTPKYNGTTVRIYILAVRCPDFNDKCPDFNDKDHLRRALECTQSLLPRLSCDGCKPVIFGRLGVYARWSDHPDRRPNLLLHPVVYHKDWIPTPAARLVL
ncbi:protein of unknown function DUF1917 [Kipferlia bialata]|uniref:Uncharacterized protein n=1 Tax=Kipferlia bialata TaxID=797122 RepID=A0A9K3GGV3_9EUKA|nr:protein of unknown function DUF1917 [Kipferlia bialata]|eukprot:g3651.t1